MIWAHLHLMLNHVPVIALLLGLGFLYGSRRETALWLFAVAGAGAVAAVLTGLGAEEFAEALPGVSHQLIERHEEWALPAAGVMAALGLISALELRGWKRAERFVPALAVLAALLVLRASLLGGLIRHSEIQGG